MKPLNIPLTGSHQTARGQRRAVWRWGVPLLFLLLLWVGVRLQGTRNPFTQTIPEETSVMIHLRPTRAQWSSLLSTVGDEILTRTGLTLRELSPYIRGSVVFFIKEDASVIIGLEGAIPETDQRLLKAHGVTVTSLGQHLYLLEEEVSPLAPSTSHVGRTDRLLPKFVGSFVSFDVGAPHTTIRIKKNAVVFDVPEAIAPRREPFVDETVIFAGTFSADTPLTFPGFLNDAFSFVSGGATLKETLQMEASESALSLFEDGSYLLTSSSNLPLATLQKLVMLQYQTQEPQVTNRSLPDGTSIQELRMSQNTPTPDEIQDNNWTILRLESEHQTFFAGKKTDGSEIFLTNSAQAVIQTTNSSPPLRVSTSCGTSQYVYISNKKFIEYLQDGKNYFSTPLPLSNSSFVHVGMDKNIFGAKIYLCVDKNSV